MSQSAKHGGPSQCFWPGILPLGHRKSTQLSHNTIVFFLSVWTGYDKIYRFFSIFFWRCFMSSVKSFLLCIYCAALPPPPTWNPPLVTHEPTMTNCRNSEAWQLPYYPCPCLWKNVCPNVSELWYLTNLQIPEISEIWLILGRLPFPSPRFGGKSFSKGSKTHVYTKHPGVLKHGWSYELGQTRWKLTWQKGWHQRIKITIVSYQLPFLIVLSWYHRSLPDPTLVYIIT